ncbi:hypothetical protein AB6A40_006409 [Gnathostoma spinigerum]|uniref:Uncharacterized protein n=1 Tax=Gnathostoma spinigerum TaxID=75299 RepID=A0ABD6EIA3_9BILA
MFLFLLLCISVTSSDGSQPQADEDFVPLEPLTEPVLKAENAPYYDVEPPLPTNIDPLAYYITIRPFFPVEGLTLRPKEKEFTFDGVTSVKIKALENGKRFTFNSYRLNYTTVNVFDANGDEVPIVNYDVEAKPKTGFIHVPMTKMLPSWCSAGQ